MIDTPARRPSPEEAGDPPPPAPRREHASPDAGDIVQESSEQSFPASDAPGWVPLHPGRPSRHPDRDRR